MAFSQLFSPLYFPLIQSNINTEGYIVQRKTFKSENKRDGKDYFKKFGKGKNAYSASAVGGWHMID